MQTIQLANLAVLLFIYFKDSYLHTSLPLDLVVAIRTAQLSNQKTARGESNENCSSKCNPLRSKCETNLQATESILTHAIVLLDDVYLQATGRTLMDAELAISSKRDLKKENKEAMR